MDINVLFARQTISSEQALKSSRVYHSHCRDSVTNLPSPFSNFTDITEYTFWMYFFFLYKESVVKRATGYGI